MFPSPERRTQIARNLQITAFGVAEKISAWIPRPSKKASILLPTAAAALTLADAPAIVRQITDKSLARTAYAQEAPTPGATGFSSEASAAPTQASSVDIGPCPADRGRLCYAAGVEDPTQQTIFLVTAPQGGDAQAQVQYVLQCDIASKPNPLNQGECLNPEGQVTIPANKSNVDQPQFAHIFANAQQPAAEPVAQPTTPSEVDPFSLPTGVVFQEPYGPGKGWLGNVDSCIADPQHYNPGTRKCTVSQNVFAPGNPIAIAFERKGIKPAEAKQGPGDRYGISAFRISSTGREQIRYSDSGEIARFSEAPIGYTPPPELFSRGVYEITANINGGSNQFVYRIQVK